SPPRPRAAGARRPDPGPGCAPRRHRGDVEVRRALPHTLTVRVRAGQRGFGGLRRAGLSPGATRARPPAPPHAITARSERPPPAPPHSPPPRPPPRGPGAPRPARGARPGAPPAAWRRAGPAPTPVLPGFARAGGVAVVPGGPA